MPFQQDIARSLGRGDQSAMGPSPSYPQPTQPQFPPSNFPYSTSEYPSLDNDLNMSDHFPHSITSQLQADATDVPQRNGDISVNTSGSVSAGMGPPQTPHQSSFSPTGPRASVDETAESVTPVEDSNKRRRSKVSRACDECRRKKIKCDSADTPDGTIKTCSNCAKSNAICEFSRVPMKRGPSKGYIKELSERVEKMESRQAAMGSPALRHSFDGASTTDLMYSPEDPMSAKRQFSFSSTSDGRNPFAPLDYQRDRMPSSGGAWSSEFPTTTGLRDRGSLALAPNERFTAVTSTPLWADVADIQPPPPKRRKVDSSGPAIKVDPSHLTNYENVVHPDFPLLPDRATILSKFIVPAQDTEALKVFATVISLLPSSRTGQQNGNSSNASKEVGLHITSRDLSDSIGQLVFIDSPAQRTVHENVLLIWSCLLLALQREFDIRTNRTDLSFASRSRLLKGAKELSEYLVKILQIIGGEDAPVQGAVKQAETLTNVMIRFDWLASGTRPNWSQALFVQPRDSPDFTREDFNRFPANPNMRFLVRFAHFLKQMQQLIQSPLTPGDDFALITKDSMIELCLHDCLDAPGAPPDFDDNTLMVRKIFGFVKLLLSPYHPRPMSPMFIVEHALRLAKDLTETATTDDVPFHYNLVDYHLFIIVVITLLTFLDKVADAKTCLHAEEALTNVKNIIEQKLAIYQHAFRTHVQESRHCPGFYGNDAEGNDVQNRTWMEALLIMINDRPKERWAISKEPQQPAVGQSGQEFFEDFLALLRTGYGRVLAGYAGRVAADPADQG